MASYEHFFIVGAQRSGTTYLYNILNEHPEIEMAAPVRPEPKFFLDDALFEHGPAIYQERYFTDRAGVRLRGEKSTSYIECEKAAKRIIQYFPRSKAVFLLRNPVDRAISNYWFSVNNGLETAPMKTAFFHEEERVNQYDQGQVSVSPFAYLRRGRYMDYIDMYRRHFPGEQVKVILFEHLVGSIDAVRNLYESLGVSPAFTPAGLQQRVNASQHNATSEISADVKRYMADYYAEPNARLAHYLGIDLAELGW
jgi:hypothetical protein